jgi:hypothetical protein
MANANEFLNKRVLKCTYDVAVNGGVDNTTYTIGHVPAGAIITGGYGIVRTAFDDGADESTTVSIGYGATAAGLMAATAGSALNAITNKAFTLLPGQPALGADASHDTAAKVAALVAAAYIVTTARTAITVTLSNDTDFTAGKIDVYIEYVV